MYIYRACKLCFGPSYNVLRTFAPACEKTAGIVSCRSVFVVLFFFLVSYLPDMALWTKGTLQKDLTQVCETQVKPHLILICFCSIVY